MRLAGWLWIAFFLMALEPSLAQAADLSIEQVWDRTEEASALRGPRALLFTGSLLAATSLGSAYVGHQRAREVEQCRDAACTDPHERQDRRLQVSVVTCVLASAAVALLVSGGVWLAKRKHTRASARPVATTPVVLHW
jgi:hypothetical protein